MKQAAKGETETMALVQQLQDKNRTNESTISEMKTTIEDLKEQCKDLTTDNVDMATELQ